MSLYDKVIAVFGMLRDSIARRADKSDIAPDFSPSSSYSEGDLVFKDGSLYRCTTAHSGEWSAGSFTETTVDDAIAYRKSRVPGGDSPGSGGSGGSGSGGSGGSGSGSGSGGGDSPGEDDDVSKCPVTGGALTFKNMSGDVTIPPMIKVDYSKAKDLSYHFAGKDSGGSDIVVESINSLSLGDGFGKSATDVSYCFAYRDIKSISLPDGFGSSATKADGCFKGCKSLVEVSLPRGFCISNNFRYLFDGCSSLIIVRIESLESTEDADFTYMFRGCTSMDSIDVSNFVNGAFTSFTAKGMFSGCTNLISVTLGDSWRNADSLREMFAGCKSILFGNTLPDGFGVNADDVSYCFSGCEWLSSVSFRSDDNPNPSDSLVLPAEFGKKAETAYGLFSGCTGLDSVSLPDWWCHASGMFIGCTDLYKVTYKGSGNEEGASFVMSSNFGKNGAESCFKDCTGIIDIDIPDWFKCSSHTFDGCTGITTLTIRSATNEAEGMLSGCSSLKSIDLSSLKDAKFETVKYMFSGCSSLKSIAIPSGFECSSAAGSFDGVFSGCRSIEEIVLNGDFGRYACPDGGHGYLKKIADVFKGCTSLKKISGTGYIKFSHSFSVADCPLEKESIDRLIENLPNASEDHFLELGSANLETAGISNFEKRNGWIIVDSFDSIPKK